jgi:predicted dehydrogenase
MDFFQRGRGDNRYLQVAAEGGRAWLDLQAQELRVYLGRSDSPVVDKLTDFDLNSLYVSELQEFLDCLESGAQPAAGPTEGALAVQVAEAARLSQRTGVAVFVEDLE